MTVKHIKGDDWYIILVDHDQNKTEVPSYRHSKVASLHGPSVEVRVERLLLPRRGHGVGVVFGYNGSESDVGLDIFLGRIGAIWMRMRSPLTSWATLDSEKHPDDWFMPRHVGVRLFPWEKCIVHLSINAVEGRSRRDDPWWREIALTLSDIVGHTSCTLEVTETGDAFVPMPEGPYRATWKREKRTFHHKKPLGRLWDAIMGPQTTVGYWLEIPGGIPAEGKGENSWDCGMDGLCGCGGKSLEEAVGRAVTSTLRDRGRYGGPHNLPKPMTIIEAEKYVAGR